MPHGGPRQAGPGPACPECGKAVPPQGAKLCPHCGYPLLLDKPPAVDQNPRKIVHKPTAQPTVDYRPAGPPMRPYPPAPPRQPAPPQQWGMPERPRAIGPYCPSCRHPNPPHRKRCEVCGTELWPGAATPATPDTDATRVVHRPRRRRPWWQIALWVAIPLVLIGTVWALAVLL